MAARTKAQPAKLETKLGDFSFEKETPNNHRFTKVLASEDERGSSIYVPKDVLTAIGSPESIEVTIRAL